MFQALEEHLTALSNETPMIKNMKKFMMSKMKTRYTTQQTKFLKNCTLLDIRYKASVSTGFDDLEKDVKAILEAEIQEESQQVIDATQGQELHNLSSFEENLSNDNNDFFAFRDDPVVVHTENFEFDSVKNEIKRYKNLTMSRTEKERCNILEWWRENKATFPCLFKAAKSHLHIPATSVPTERIFSLDGYVVRDRRSKLLADNVNKVIFLKKNQSHIPTITSILTEDNSN